MRIFASLLCCLVGISGMIGCTTATTTNTARAAKEQLLLSNAVDRAYSKINFAPLAGQRVFVEEKYLDCVDKPYVAGSLRHRVLREGARLVSKPEEADVIMEVRSGGVGTDSAETFLGVPEIALPGMLTLPEIKVATKTAQQGYAKIGLVLMDAKSGQVLGDGGVSIAQSDDANWFVMGVGPFQNGTIMHEVHQSKTRQPGQPWTPLPSAVAFAPTPTMDSGFPTSPGSTGGPPIEFATQSRELP